VSAEAQYNLCQYEDCITSLTRYHAIAPVESATLLLLSDAYRALGMGPEADKAFGAFLGRHKISSTDSGRTPEGRLALPVTLSVCRSSGVSCAGATDRHWFARKCRRKPERVRNCL
jgi:hypothetical protein